MKTTSPSLFIIICYQVLFLFTGLLQTLGTQYLYYQKATSGASFLTNLVQYIGMAAVGLLLLPNWLENRSRYLVGNRIETEIDMVDFKKSQEVDSVVIWCAILSFFLLGRKLSFIQSISIVGVSFGLALSALGINQSSEVTETLTIDDDNEEIEYFNLSRSMFGMILVSFATLGYACIYVFSDLILNMKTPYDMIPPSPETICFLIGSFGTGFSMIYIIFYTIPNWDILITQEMAKLSQHDSTFTIIFIYLLLIIVSFAHNLAYYWLMKHLGNVSTGLLNSVRAIVVFGLSHWFFCQLDSGQCFNIWKGLSAAVVVGFVTSFSLCSKSDDTK
ncbi:12916_t:CDS:2 [Entrophospora sp. SA101]|nr:12916_t:CDS:2 [Entrophospora sp. SA101]